MFQKRDLPWSYEGWTADVISEIRGISDYLEISTTNVSKLYQQFSIYHNQSKSLLEILEKGSLNAEETYLSTILHFEINLTRRNFSLLIYEPRKFDNKQVRDLEKHLSDLVKWYHFMIALKIRLYDYHTYYDDRKELITEIANTDPCGWKQNSTKLDERKFNQFTNKLEQLAQNRIDNLNYSETNGIEINIPKASLFCTELQEFVDYKEPVISCKNGRRRIKGDIIKIVNGDTANNNEECEYDTLEVFASKKIFLEIDLQILGRKQVFIFAPVWEVVPETDPTILRVVNSSGHTFLGVAGSIVNENLLNFKCDEPCESFLLNLEKTFEAKLNISNMQKDEFQYKINEYKRYICEKFMSLDVKTLRRQELINFADLLYSDESTASFYNVDGLTQELEDLQSLILGYNKRDEFLPMFKAFASRIKIRLKETKISKEDQQDLSYLYTTVLSTIWSYKDKFEIDAVTNIKKYLLNSIEDIHDLQNAINDVAIKRFSRRYRVNIINESKKGLKIIKETLVPEINKINENLRCLVGAVLKEARNKQEIIRPNDMKFWMSWVLQKTSETLKNVAFISNTQWAFLLFSAGGTLDFTDHSLFDQDALKKSMVLPEGVLNIMHDFADILKVKTEQKIEILKGLNSSLPSSSSLKNLKLKIRDSCSILIKSLDKDHPVDPNVDNQFEEIQSKILEQKKIIEESQADDKQEVLNALEKAKRTLEMAELSPDLYLKYKDDLSAEKFNYRASSKELIFWRYSRKIDNTLMPLLRDLQGRIKFALHSDAKSFAHVKEIYWKMQDSLKDLTFLMQRFTAGFDVQSDFSDYLGKISEVLKTISKIQTTQVDYQDQEELGNYIAEIKSAPYEDIDWVDETRSERMANLTLIIKTNLLRGFTTRAVFAYKQFVFPAGRQFKVEDGSCLFLPNNSCTFENVAKKVKEELKNIISEIQDPHFLSNQGIDFRNADFYTNVFQPFFTWRNETYSKSLERLLFGTKIILNAKANRQIDVVKFNKIGIKLRTIDEQKQGALDDVLKKMHVNLIHHGINYYRCSDECYSTSGKSMDFNFSFKKDEAGNPISYNQVYKKVTNADFTLSPFTWWSIQLVGDHKNFLKLLRFIGSFHLDLEGHGRYYQKHSTSCAPFDFYFEGQNC